MMRKKGCMRHWLPVLALIFLASGCGKEPPAADVGKPRAIKVTLAECTVRDLERTLQVVGTLYGNEEATLSAKVPGRIAGIDADVGDRVAAGAALVTIDPQDYRLALAQREAALKEALTKLSLETLPAGDIDFTSIPAVRRAKLLYDNAESKYRRAEPLNEHKPPLISAQDFADLKTGWQTAQATYDLEVQTARETLAAARSRAAERDLANQLLDDATVRAPRPADGALANFAVTDRLTSVGEYVREGTQLVRVIDDHLIKLRAPVPERYRDAVAVGQQVSLAIEGAGQPSIGTLKRISPQIDVSNRSFLIEAWFDNADGRLRAGAFAEASITLGVAKGAILVPHEAVIAFAGVRKVFSVSDGVAHEHEIKTGLPHGELIEVVGYDGKTAVVVSGASKLVDGMAVAVQEAQGESGP
jgi:RND family efflux transporter MFP subunit